MLQVENVKNEKFLIMSESAFNSLDDKQLATINEFNEIIYSDLKTIEKLGGGSARCMIAENFLRKAIQIMQKDPIVNDHYGDVLWKLNRKIQAKYYWESALNSEDAENKIKENISKKLLKGLDES